MDLEQAWDTWQTDFRTTFQSAQKNAAFEGGSDKNEGGSDVMAQIVSKAQNQILKRQGGKFTSAQKAQKQINQLFESLFILAVLSLLSNLYSYALSREALDLEHVVFLVNRFVALKVYWIFRFLLGFFSSAFAETLATSASVTMGLLLDKKSSQFVRLLGEIVVQVKSSEDDSLVSESFQTLTIGFVRNFKIAKELVFYTWLVKLLVLYPEKVVFQVFLWCTRRIHDLNVRIPIAERIEAEEFRELNN